MSSIRSQLLVGAAAGMAVVLLASGFALHALMHRALLQALDESLLNRARALATLVEQDDAGLSFEPDETRAVRRDGADTADYYQIWRADGSVLARSASLGPTAAFVRPQVAAREPHFIDLTLVGGRSGRAVAMVAQPRIDEDAADGDAGAEIIILAARDTAGLQATLLRLRGILVGVGVMGVIVSAICLALVIRRSLRPLHQLTWALQEFRSTDLAARIRLPHTPVELRPVLDRLNELLGRLESAFARERRFTGDVAHELRTPLAGLRAGLEVARSRGRSADQLEKAIDAAHSIGLQMQRTVETLLCLARADAGQLDLRVERIDLQQLARECWASWQERAAERGLHAAWTTNGPAPVEADAEQLRLVLANLFENAVQHASPNSPIEIAVDGAHGGGRFSICNPGGRVAPGEIERVFERFWRADASFAGNGQRHCGLGLSLCKSVVERMGGDISAATDAAGAFCVTVRLGQSRPERSASAPA